MLARLPRPAALLVALLLLLACVWCLTTTPPPIRVAKKGGYTDVRLYHDIAAAVSRGTPYHAAAAALHRAHFYPLHPFVTMRLPTLTELAVLVGWDGVQRIAYVGAFLAIFLWVVATEHVLHWSERVLVAVAVAAGVSMVLRRDLMALHEYWAGLALALGAAGVVGWPRRWWWVMLPIAMGLFIRELTLPFVLLALAFALAEQRWREAAAWLALIGAFAVFMAVHAQMEASQARPTDLISTGWHAFQGPSGFLKAVVHTSILQSLPEPLALLAAMLPLFGWAALDGRAGRFCLILWTGYAVMIGAFARPDTFYWGAIMPPGYFVGFALLPRALWQLAEVMRGRGGANGLAQAAPGC